MAIQDEDDLGFTGPRKPSDLRTMPDDELFVYYRKMAFANRYAFDRMIEMETSFRHITALREFASAMRASSRRMEVLTLAILAVTALLVWREFF